MTTTNTAPDRPALRRAARAGGRRALPLAASMALLALIGAGCSSSSGSTSSGSTASTGGTASAGTTDISKVTLHIGDQAGLRGAGAAHRVRADQQAAIQGHLVGLHLRAAHAPGDGRRGGGHRQRR